MPLDPSCTRYVTSALPNFKSFFFNSFKDAVNLLNRKEFRKHYVYTCLPNAPKDVVDMILFFRVVLVEHR